MLASPSRSRVKPRLLRMHHNSYESSLVNPSMIQKGDYRLSHIRWEKLEQASVRLMQAEGSRSQEMEQEESLLNRSANIPLNFLPRVKLVHARLQRNSRVLRKQYQKRAILLGFSAVTCISFLRSLISPEK